VLVLVLVIESAAPLMQFSMSAEKLVMFAYLVFEDLVTFVEK
jgi:hypothetical protein